jgi:glycosyltransferase 2 family protein
MNRYKKWLIGALFISVASIALVLGLTFDSETIETLRKIKLEYILASAIFHIFSYFIWGARTRALCKSLGYEVKYLKIVEIILSGVFVAGITPSSVGGEPLRIHMLYLNKIPFGRATCIIIGERLLDAFLIFVSLPFALYIMGDILSNYKLDVALLTASCLAFFALIVFIYGLCKPEKIKNIIFQVIRKFATILGKWTDDEIAHFIEQVDREMDIFHESVRILISEGKKGLLWGMFFTILFWTVEFFQLVLILMGLSKIPSILTAFAAQVLLVVVMIVPSTPGASGIAELGAATIFSVFVDASILGVTVISWRALTYYMNLLIGGFISLKVVKDMDLINKLIEKSTELQRSPEKDI